MSQIKLSNFISLEFFGFGNKPKEEEKEPPVYEWINQNTSNKKLNQNVTPKEQEITLKGHAANIFHRDGKIIHDVHAEFKKDYEIYKQIFNSNKSALVSYGKAQEKINNDLDAIANPHTTFEELKKVILKHQADANKYSGNNSIAAKFHEPSIHLLGNYETGFLSNKEKAFETRQPLKHIEPIQIQSVSRENIDSLASLAFDIWFLSSDIFEVRDDMPMCIDQTDSPIRGFIDEVTTDDELMSILNPFSEYGMVYEDHNAGLIDVLYTRTENLSEALWNYIKNSCE